MTNSETSPKAEGRKPNHALAAIDESQVANGILRICSFGFPSDFISTRLPDVGFFTLAILAMFSSGCAGYKLGPTNGLAAQEKSVEIAPFANQTLQPRLGDAVTFQIRKQLQHEGTYRLATGREGDILVTGVVTHYGRQGVSFVPTDVSDCSSDRTGTRNWQGDIEPASKRLDANPCGNRSDQQRTAGVAFVGWRLGQECRILAGRWELVMRANSALGSNAKN